MTGEIPAPPGAPTVLLYSHYDVVPAGDQSLWTSPPFEPTERDGALYGRGVADTKSNVLAHVGALRAWGGRPPVGIKLCIEGYEEIGSGALPAYPATDPGRFAADALVIGDMGSIRPGVPTLTTALRGTANVIVELRTLATAKHSGLYGGAAPDALLALLRALQTLHDDAGNVAVAGLRRTPWDGPSQPEADFRELGTVLDGMPLIGSGELGRARLVRAGDHRDRDRRAVGRRRRQRRLAVRARRPQRARPSRAGGGRGAAGGDRPPARAAPVRDRAERQRRPDRQRLRRPHRRPRLRRRARRLVGRVGRRRAARRQRRLDPDRQRARAGAAGRGGAAGRHRRRLRQHPRAGRADAAVRVRARGRRRGRLPRPLRGGVRGDERDDDERARRRQRRLRREPRAASRSGRWRGSSASATRSRARRSSSSRSASA